MRTQMTLELLKEQLQLNCGDMLEACRGVGVSLIFVETWKKDDPKIAAELQEAVNVGRQGLVSAAIKRAVHGVEKGVYYKGEKVDTEVQYSDSLLTTLLKTMPEFQKEDGNGGVQVNVNVANIMPRADNYEAWLEMKRQTLEAPKTQLPAPEVTDAEYEEVSPFAGLGL